MSENIRYNNLLDHYGELLTSKQRDVLELHFGYDLSLSEIAEELSISRQAVHDSIQRGEAKLNEFEDKLGFAQLHKKIQKTVDKARILLESVEYKDSKSQSKISEIFDMLDIIDLD